MRKYNVLSFFVVLIFDFEISLILREEKKSKSNESNVLNIIHDFFVWIIRIVAIKWFKLKHLIHSNKSSTNCSIRINYSCQPWFNTQTNSKTLLKKWVVNFKVHYNLTCGVVSAQNTGDRCHPFIPENSHRDPSFPIHN